MLLLQEKFYDYVHYRKGGFGCFTTMYNDKVNYLILQVFIICYAGFGNGYGVNLSKNPHLYKQY